MNLHFTKWDLIPIFSVLVVAAAIFFLFLPAKAPANYVEIYKDGILIKSLPLAEDVAYQVEGPYTNVITIRDGEVAVTQSSCPGGDCMACGWFRTTGSIVCLPNGVEVRVLSGNTDVDIIVR